MNFLAYPQDYQSVHEPAFVSIYDCDPRAAIEVEVLDARRSVTLGRKRFRGADYHEFDASGCLRESIAPRPVGSYQSPAVWARANHCVKTMARMEIFQTPEILLTGARKSVLPLVRLTDAPLEKRLAADGFDEISALVKDANLYAILRLSGPDGANARIDSASVQVAHEMVAMAFGLPDMAGELAQQGCTIGQFDRLEATLYCNDSPIVVQRYRLEAARPEAVGVGWFNAHGAVDCYGMFTEVNDELRVERTHARGPFGDHRTEGMHARRLVTLLSDYEPRATLRWLEGIATAPRAWLLGAPNRFREMEVVSARLVGEPGEPQRLEVVLREMAAIRFQQS